MLPPVPTLDAYRRIYLNEQVWLPAMQAICREHGLDETSLRRAPPGSHIVYWVESDRVIKLFAPLWAGDAATESLALQVLVNQGHFQVPRLLAQGELDGWPYLVLSRLPGVPLEAIWERLLPAEKEQVAAGLGRLMAALHRYPTGELQALRVDWPVFLSQQIETCLGRQAAAGATLSWLDQMAAFLADLPPLYEQGFAPVLLHADLSPEHLLCEHTPAGWQICGVIDFGDAMLGHPGYEFVAPGFLLHGSRSLRRAMLLAYGFSPADLDESLSHRLMAYTLLHRFALLPEWLELVGKPPPADLDELQVRLWSL
jgi:hygromycin-B 7''-O-kinase